MVSAGGETPLSVHTVHVPPRQTVHELVKLDESAACIVLTKVEWASPAKHVTTPREALYLAVGRDSLQPGATSLAIVPTKRVRVEVGNWSDRELEVAFEIWGEP